MDIEYTEIEGVLIFTCKRFADARGFFSETWNKNMMASHGFDIDFAQDNHSLSTKAGVVRGLHFQVPPHAQDKLVRVARGAILDVAVDIRKGSPSYGKWVAVELSADNGKQLLVPKGFMHGFATRTDNTEVLYKCSDVYVPECEGSIRYDDPDLGIDWSLTADALLSDKDLTAGNFANFETPFIYEGSS